MWTNLFNAVPDALVMVDRGGRITHANLKAEALFGYAPGELTGLGIESLIPEGARTRHRAHRDAYMDTPRVRPMGATEQTLTGLRRDGVCFPVEIALSPIEVDGSRHFLASVRDVSETLQARRALVRARYDAVIARVGQLALESRDETEVIDSLPALLAEALIVDCVAIVMRRADSRDVDTRAAIGLRADWPDLSVALDRRDSPLHGAMSAGRQISGDLDLLPGFEGIASIACVPLLDRDLPLGAIIALSATPQRFEHDAMHLLQSAANVVAAMMQRRRSEEQLAHAQRLDTVGQLTGGIAHDFNNLLTVVSGSLQLLETDGVGSADTAELIGSASRAVARGGELTSKLLAFARRQRLTPSAQRAQELLPELGAMLRRTLGDAIQLDIRCADDVPAVYADAVQLDAALVNLALNARDAMPRGGRIDISAERRDVSDDDATSELHAGRYVVFSVQDTGHGMTPEVRVRALDPFFTTKAAGRGSGMGLSMVYGFVKQSGGHLAISSELGYGTRIDLFLPVASGTVARTDERRAAALPSGSEVILVVEDEADVGVIAGAFLRSLGYRVVSATNARDALARLAEEPDIALLFTDVMLGSGMNGIELAQAARAHRRELPVVLTSGYADPEATGGVAADGGYEMLRKPYRREQLAAAIRRQLGDDR
jgi:PAS domain S-box-containing protein